MASITRHRRSSFWTAVFKDEKGIWRRKSTKLTEKGKARKLAEEWEAMGQRAREGTLVESNSRELLNGILQRVTGEQLRIVKTRELFDEWLTRKKNKSEGTEAAYRGVVKMFLNFIGPKADQPIESIIGRDCQKFYDWLMDERKVSPARAEFSMTVIGSVFIYGKRHGLVSGNPATSVEKVERVHQVKRMTFTPAQVKMLIDAAENPDWKTCVLIGFYCGLRLNDAANLEWKNVDFVKNAIIFEVGKTRQSLVLPMHKTLSEHLQKIAGDVDGPIMPSLAGQRTSSRSGLTQQFKDVMRKAGIGFESVQTSGKNKLSRLSFHSLRATCNSSLFNSEIPFEIRKKIVGHSSEQVNQRYTVAELDTLRAAMNKLPSLTV